MLVRSRIEILELSTNDSQTYKYQLYCSRIYSYKISQQIKFSFFPKEMQYKTTFVACETDSLEDTCVHNCCSHTEGGLTSEFRLCAPLKECPLSYTAIIKTLSCEKDGVGNICKHKCCSENNSFKPLTIISCAPDSYCSGINPNIPPIKSSSQQSSIQYGTIVLSLIVLLLLLVVIVLVRKIRQMKPSQLKDSQLQESTIGPVQSR